MYNQQIDKLLQEIDINNYINIQDKQVLIKLYLEYYKQIRKLIIDNYELFEEKTNKNIQTEYNRVIKQIIKQLKILRLTKRSSGWNT